MVDFSRLFGSPSVMEQQTSSNYQSARQMYALTGDPKYRDAFRQQERELDLAKRRNIAEAEYLKTMREIVAEKQRQRDISREDLLLQQELEKSIKKQKGNIDELSDSAKELVQSRTADRVVASNANRARHAGTNVDAQEGQVRANETLAGAAGTYRSQLSDVLHGRAPISKLALGPLARMNDAAFGRTGAGLIGRGLAWGGLGLVGAVGLSRGLPIAAQQIEAQLTGTYNQLAGNDITTGQSAGFSGRQGFGFNSMVGGLGNRVLAPIRTLAALGGLPVPGFFGSEAQQYGARRRFEAFQAGFNPFDALSVREAQGIAEDVVNRGYRPNSLQEAQVRGRVNRLKNTRGGDPSAMLDYIDVFVKRLGESIDTISQDLEDFGALAQAAGKSVDQFTKEVTAVANELVSQGMNATSARALSKTYSSFRNIPGEELAGLTQGMGKNAIGMMAILRNNPQIMNDPFTLMGVMENPALAAEVGGSPARNMVDMVRDTFNMYRQIAGPDTPMAFIAQRVASDLGMDPAKVLQLYEGGGDLIATERANQAFANIGTAFDAAKAARRKALGGRIDPNEVLGTDQARRQTLIQSGTGGKAIRQAYDEWLNSLSMQSGITSTDIASYRSRLMAGEDYNKIQREVASKIGKAADETSVAQTAQILLGASPELQKLIVVLNNTNPTMVDSGTLRRGEEWNTRKSTWLDKTAYRISG